jgi:hypothetical protein
LAPSYSPNAPAAENRTGGFMNGRSWKIHTWEEKITYVVAYGEGVLNAMKTTC